MKQNRLKQKFKIGTKVSIKDGPLKGNNGKVMYTSFKGPEPSCIIMIYYHDSDYFYAPQHEVLEKYLEEII